MKIQTKKQIVKWFMENVHTWQRVNACAEHFHDLIYNERGEYTETGKEIDRLIGNLDKMACYVEHNTDYSCLENV